MIKKLLFTAMTIFALVGVYVAERNLPVVTNCSFYGNCPTPNTSPAPSATGTMKQMAAGVRNG